MRQLLPEPRGRVDLAKAYAYPTELPWVRANMIESIDGAATVKGRSGGLGNQADRALFSLLRQLADVILVGAGTARTERYGPEPALPGFASDRRARGQSPAPAMAIVSSSLDLDEVAERFGPGDAPLLVITSASAPPDRRRRLERVADVVLAGESRVDLAAAIAALQARGYLRISCEGGARLLTQLVAAGRLDELCLTIAPRLIAGGAGRVLDGPLLDPPADCRLAHLLESDGYLFARYLVSRADPALSSGRADPPALRRRPVRSDAR